MVIYKHITTVINWKEGKIMSVGENIKKRREAKGLSQAELAGAIGVGQSYLSQIERGTKGSVHTAWEADRRKSWNVRWTNWLKGRL